MPEPGERAELEQRVREAIDAGDPTLASERAIRLYGPELLAYLTRAAGDADLAEEAFAEFAEDLVRGLPSFEWRSSLRTWSYAVARNALRRVRRRGHRRREVALTTSRMGALVAEVRERTATFLRTETRALFAELRDELSPEEDELLVLRISRKMSWLEVVEVLAPEAEDPRREAAALRKRFERLKVKLASMAKTRG